MRLIDITGERFGKLVVLEHSGSDKWRNTMWLCKCDCGNVKRILGHALRTRNTKSCGCLSIGLRNKSRKTGNPKNTSGQNLHIWRKVEKEKALLKLKGQVDFTFKDEVCNDFHREYQKLWFAVLERAIWDIGLRAKHRKGRDSYDTTYYFKREHRRHGMLEEICEALDLYPEYVVKVLYEKGVLPIPEGHFE